MHSSGQNIFVKRDIHDYKRDNSSVRQNTLKYVNKYELLESFKTYKSNTPRTERRYIHNFS